MGSDLVRLLAEEEKTLASLGGPGGNVVRNIGGLVSLEAADGLQVDSLVSEPEELLGEEKVPGGGRKC